MKLEGAVPDDYRGDPDYGRDWLEAAYFPDPRGPGFLVMLGLCLVAFNIVPWLAPRADVWFTVIALAVLASVLAATGIRGSREKGSLLWYGVAAVILLAWAGWLATDLADTGAVHRHLVASLAALFLAFAWHRRRFHRVWWRVALTSEAWNVDSLVAYAGFLAGEIDDNWRHAIALGLYRAAAEEALKTPRPSDSQIANIRSYVEAQKDGLGGSPNFGELRWWKEKLYELEGYAEEARMYSRDD